MCVHCNLKTIFVFMTKQGFGGAVGAAAVEWRCESTRLFGRSVLCTHYWMHAPPYNKFFV